MLIAPLTTVYYDTGFLIGLKGFVAAIVGGLASYPLALAGALLVGHARSLLLVLGQRLQGGDRLHADHPGAVVALAAAAATRRTRRMTPPAHCASRVVVALCGCRGPCLPEFWVTLLNYIGLYALVPPGLVLLTGVGGMTSFGQAAFVGLGAYATAWVCTSATAPPRWLARRLALLPWLGLAAGRGDHLRGRLAAGRHHAAAVGPLPAAVHDRLGPEPVLPVRQPRVPGRAHRHRRRAAAA